MTRPLTLCAVLVALAAAGAAVAQAPAGRPDPRAVQMRGNRFAPLTYDQMTPAQQAMVQHLLSGPRANANNGPFNVLLRSPEVGDLGQQFGAATRFQSSLPQRLYELAILVTARHWTAQYEWQAHSRAALQAGVAPAIVEAIRRGERPTGLQPDEAAVYGIAFEMLTHSDVSDATFAQAKQVLGERGIVDTILVTGWYSTVSMLLNLDRYPLADGAAPPLAPLRQTVR